MKRTILNVLVAFALLFSSPFSALWFSPQPVQAALSELEQKKKALEDEVRRKSALAQHEAAQAKEIERVINQASAQISNLQGSIAGTDRALSETQAQIEGHTQQIAGLESELRRIKDQQDALVRKMYMMAQGTSVQLRLFSNSNVSEQ